MTEFFVLGSLHGYMLQHPRYTLPVFLDAMHKCQPDLILTEARREHPDAANASIDGGIEQSLVYAFGETLGVPVHAVDWFDEALIQSLESEEKSQGSAELEAQLEHLFSAYMQMAKTASFVDLHSPQTQNMVRKIYSLQEQLGMVSSRRRNERICGNIVECLTGIPTRRAIIVFGLDHKYFIEDYLIANGYKTLTAEFLFDEGCNLDLQHRNSIKQKALSNLVDSESLLRLRMDSDYYDPLRRDRLVGKMPEFAIWRNTIMREL
jgi:hypothetical protein